MLPSELPSNRAERWAVLDAFLAKWFPAPRGPAGVSEELLTAAAARIGSPLPLALREWFLRFGRRADVWNVQDHLFPPDAWCLEGDVLVVARENQGVVDWGIAVRDLGDEDPPVMISDESAPSGWLEAAPSVSVFALLTAASNAKFSEAPTFKADGSFDDERVVERLRAAYPRLPVPDANWPANPTHFLGTDELLVEIHADVWVWAVAITRDAMADFRRVASPFVDLQPTDW